LRLTENRITFTLREGDGSTTKRTVDVKKLCLGRHCSRDIGGTRRVLDGIREEGYTVHGNPNICRKSRYLLTQEPIIEVQGNHTSGEVEYVAIMDGGETLISVGSDHNDRSLTKMWTGTLGKIYDTAKCKQMAPAVIAKEAWRYEDIMDHWDQLNLRSHVTLSGERIPYQDFKLSELVTLDNHLRKDPWLKEDGVALLGGSSSTLPGLPPELFQFQTNTQNLVYPTDFHFEIHDPVLNRTIKHSYTTQTLEEPGSKSL
jgi:hypothetical protein